MTAAAESGEASVTTNALPKSYCATRLLPRGREPREGHGNVVAAGGNFLERGGPGLEGGGVIALGLGADFHVILALGEDRAARHNLAAHTEFRLRLAQVAIGAEHAVGGIGIAKIGDVDDQRDAALDAGHAVHGLEAIEQVAFGVAIHVFEQVVGHKAASFTLRRPAGHQVTGGIGGCQNTGEQANPAHNLQHAKRSCARMSRWATCTP